MSIYDFIKIENLVVDSGGFFKPSYLQNIAQSIYTIDQVISEIKDKETKMRLQILPYEIKFKVPTQESIKFVTEFSKKTGDYPSLSAVDIKLMALVLQLERETNGGESIRKEPFQIIKYQSTFETETLKMGYFLEKECDKKTISSNKNLTALNFDETTNNSNENFISHNNQNEFVSVINKKFCYTDFAKNDQSEEKCINNERHKKEQNEYKEYKEKKKVDDEEDEEESDDGWITPSNMKKFINSNPNKHISSFEPVKVACLTTDFAMQNVLIQMGLNVVSLEGLLIKQTKSFVLRCYGCFKISKDMKRKFCKHCGNQTLQKVSMSLSDDGEVICYLSKHKQPCIRGLRYSLPLPKGGKHSKNPILTEDQRCAQQRNSKNSSKTSDELDHLALESPFKMNDINSRAASFGYNKTKQHNASTDFHGNAMVPLWKKGNPNSSKKVYGRKK